MGTSQRSLTAAGYVVLFLLGVFEALLGSFQYNQGPVPLVAIVFVVVIFATCVAGGVGFGTFGAGVLPAVGWILTSFILAMPRPNGSVIITATAAGEWYLYGGALASAVGASAAFLTRAARSPRPR
jgi:hypothetical membrane protein